MKHKFITVRWNDHHESENAWDGAGAEPSPAKFESKGYVIHESEEILEITNTIPLNSAAGNETFGRPLRIVKSAIFFRSDQRKVKDAAKT